MNQARIAGHDDIYHQCHDNARNNRRVDEAVLGNSQIPMKITPHVAHNDNRADGSAIDGRTSRHTGYAASQKVRKWIEEGFGLGETIGLIRQVKVCGLERVDPVFRMTFISWNLTRLYNLQG